MKCTFYLDVATGKMLKILSEEMHISKSAVLRMLIAERYKKQEIKGGS